MPSKFSHDLFLSLGIEKYQNLCWRSFFRHGLWLNLLCLILFSIFFSDEYLDFEEVTIASFGKSYYLKLMEHGGEEILEKEEHFFNLFDDDKNEGLDYFEFLSLMDRRYTHDQFDKSGNGLLEMNEIRHFLISITGAPENTPDSFLDDFLKNWSSFFGRKDVYPRPLPKLF